MSAQCEVNQRRRRAHMTLRLLGAGLALAFGLNSGCNRVVVCKAEEMALLPQQQYCSTCKPLDHELLDRLNTTELPWPVRQAVDDCAAKIHKLDPAGFVTKKSLRECTGSVSTLDDASKAGLAALINKSNLAEEEDNQNFHAKCDVMMPAVSPPMPAAPTLPPPPVAPSGMPDSAMPGAAPYTPGAMPAPSALPPTAMPGPTSAPVLPPPPAAQPLPPVPAL